MSAKTVLGDRLAEAVERGNADELCQVYRDIAEASTAEGDTDAACFFWTQALVFAMTGGDSDAESMLRERLESHGRL